MGRILVTGIVGQIGSFVADRLVQEGHHVIGVEHTPSQRGLATGVELHVAELTADTVEPLLDACGAIDGVIHLAGKTSVGESWKIPMETFDANARTTAALAYACQGRGITLVNASSAEIFGNAKEPVQNEDTPIAPVSPYGVAKAAGHMAVQLTRETMGSRATNLIFFLGESARRAPHFVFRKITRGLARVKLGLQECVSLGNTTAIRDFCHADDYARAAVMFVSGGEPGDYVLASGEAHTVQDIATTTCEFLGLDPGQVLRTDPSLFRTADIPRLVGDSSRARALGWTPSMTFIELVRSIAEHDLEAVRREERHSS